MEKYLILRELRDLAVSREFEAPDYTEYEAGPIPVGPPQVLGQDRSVAGLTQYVGIDLGMAKSRSGVRFRLNPTTAVYYPPAFRPGEYDMVLYLHGHKGAYPGNTVWIDGYLDGNRFPFFALREEVQPASQNLIFVAPTLGPHSQAGTLDQPGGFDHYIEQVAQSVDARFQKSLPRPRRILLAAHSGGGSPMQRIIGLNDRYAQQVAECWGFDSLYGGVSALRNWAKKYPEKRVFIYYLRTTAENARALAGYRLPNVQVQQSSKGHFWVPKLHLRERIFGSATAGNAAPSALNYEFEVDAATTLLPLNPASPFHSSRLSSDKDGALTDFKRKVYTAHVRRSADKNRPFVPDQTDIQNWADKNDLTYSIDNGKINYHLVNIHSRMIEPLKNLLTAARSDAARAGVDSKIYLRSGYRSATTQFQSWDNNFSKYYWRAVREGVIKKNDFSDGAAAALAQFIGGKLAAPGYSNHQHGRAIDFVVHEKDGWHQVDTDSDSVRDWRKTWFWNWLDKNAHTFGFKPYSAEPWHWEYWSDVQTGNSAGTTPASHQGTTGAGSSNALGGLLALAGTLGLGAAALSLAVPAFVAALASGSFDDNKIADIIFYLKYPQAPKPLTGKHPLAPEWAKIKRAVSSLRNKPQWTAQAPAPAIANSPLTGQYGRLVVDTSLPVLAKCKPVYQFTQEDTLWMARLVSGEAGDKDNADGHAVLWAMFNRFGLYRHKVSGWTSFAAFLRQYSTPLQPMLKSVGAAKRVWRNHVANPNKFPVVSIDETYRGTNIKKVQYQKHIDLQNRRWEDIKAPVRTLVIRMLNGEIPNPGIGLASEFGSTRVYFNDQYGRYPSLAEWETYTRNYAARKKWEWIGPKSNLDQLKNTFFLRKAHVGLPGEAVRIVPAV